MRPTALAMGGGIRQVRRQSVAAQDAGKGRAEQVPQDVGSTRGGDGREHNGWGDECPEPACRPVRPMAGFVSVENRLVRQRLSQLLIRRRHSGTRLFPRVLRTSQAERNLQDVCEQPLHDQARQAADDRQIRNQRGELRAELPGALVGHGRHRACPAGRTVPLMTAILGKMRGDRGDLGDLMPARVALIVPRVEAVRTAATGLRDEVDDRIHSPKGHQLTMVARMARLTTGFAATLDAPSPQTLSSCEAIG